MPLVIKMPGFACVVEERKVPEKVSGLIRFRYMKNGADVWLNSAYIQMIERVTPAEVDLLTKGRMLEMPEPKIPGKLH